MARKTVKRYGNTYIYEDGKLVQTIRGNTQKKGESGAQGQAVVTKETYKKQTKPASSSNTKKQQVDLTNAFDRPDYVSGKAADMQKTKKQQNLQTKNLTTEPQKKATYTITEEDNKKAQDVSLNRYKGAFNWQKRIDPTSEKTKTAANELINAAFTSSNRVADNYRTMESEAREKSRDNKYTIEEREAFTAQADAYKQQSVLYEKQAQFDEQIARTDFDFDNEENTDVYINKGKSIDKYLLKSDEEKKASIAKSTLGSLNEDDTLKTAALAMTEDEKNRYYYVLGKKGEDAAKNYLKALYDVGDLGVRYSEQFSKGLDKAVEQGKISDFTRNSFGAGTAFIEGFTSVGESVQGIGLSIQEAIDGEVSYNEMLSERLATKIVNTEREKTGNIGIDIGRSIGQMIPAIVVSVATMGAGAPAMVSTIAATGTTFGTVYGKTYMDTRRQGYDAQDAASYSTIIAGLESGLQFALSGVSQLSGGAITKNLSKSASAAINSTVKNPIVRKGLNVLVTQGINSSGEFSEEYLQGFFEPMMRNVVLRENNEVDFLSADNFYQGAVGYLTAFLFNAPSSVTGTSQYVTNAQKIGKSLSAEQLLEQIDFAEEGTDAKKTADFILERYSREDILNGNVNPIEAGMLVLENASNEQRNANFASFINGDISWNEFSDVERAYLVSPQNAERIASTYGININAEMSPVEIKDAIKAVSEENRVSARNYAEVVTDEKVRSLYESVEKNAGVNIRVQNLNESINGFVDENGIVINRSIANTEDGARFVISHELTHGTEASQYYNDLLENVKEVYGENFAAEVENRINTYAEQGVELTEESAQQEVVADFVASEIFTDYNKLKRFVDSNNSLAQKIFNWIKEQIKKLSGKNTLLDTAYKNFEKAFKDVNITDETKFSYSSSLDKITEKSYNRGAWALANNVITRQESALLYQKTKDVNFLRETEKTDDGFYIVEVAEDDKAHKLVAITDGNYNEPSIERLYRINLESDTDTELIIEEIKLYEILDSSRAGDYVKQVFEEEIVTRYDRYDMPNYREYRQERSQNERVYGEENNRDNRQQRDRRRDNGKTQYSISKKLDTEYLNAVENNDWDTVKNLVVEAANTAGYTTKLFHGTRDFGFTQLKTEGLESWMDWSPFFATDTLEIAKTYSGQTYTRPIATKDYSSKAGNYDLFTDTSGFLEVDANNSNWDEIVFNDELVNTRQIAEYARDNGYTGVKISNLIDDGGQGSFRQKNPGNIYVFFDPQTQVKSADTLTYDDNGNIIPLSKRFNRKNNDIRYSISKKTSTDLTTQPEEQINELVEEYGAKEKGLKKGVALPKKTSESKTLSDLAVSLLSDPDLSAEAKQRLQKGVVAGDLSYIPITNKSLEAKAQEIFNQKNNDLNRVRTEEWQSVVDGNSRFTPEKSALAITLYNEYLKAGDTQSAYEIALELRSFATEAGQTVQSLSMLNKMTPDGQLYSLERSLARMNKKWRKQYKGFEGAKINEALAKKLLEAKTEEEISAVRNEIISDIATQVPASWFEKMQAWRIISMLLNPITHVRNIAGNAASIPARSLKDLIGVGIENIAEKTGFIKKEDRTKSVLNPFSKADKKYIDAGNESYNSIKDILSENNKSEEMAIQRKKRIFKNKIGEFLRKVNFTALAAEDALFSKLAYTRAYAKAVKARGLNPEAISTEDDVKISEYAIEQALKATYRESNAVANALEKFKRLNAVTYVIGEGMMPFVKTPMNIMKQGVEFSPIGVIKGIIDTTVGVKNGKYTPAQAIDNLATGLSGTAIMAIGAFLASQGLLSGGDDEEDQNYALVIGDKSYTLDWAMPVAMPLFMGVEMFNTLDTGDIATSFTNMLDSMTKISEPLFNFTLLSNINQTIKNVGNSESPMVDFIMNLAISYAGQFVPSVFGAISRVVDDTKRTTYYQPDSDIPYGISSFLQGIQKKVAGVTMQPKLDRWGNEVKSGDVGQRIVENMLSPGYYSEKPNTNVDIEIDKIFLMTGDDSVIPPVANKKYTVNGKERVFNAAEYTKFSKVLGQTSYKAVEEIINSNEYKFMLPSEKAAAIKTAYDFATEKAKTEMFKDYQADRVSQAVIDGKFSVSEYAYYKSVTDDMTGASIATDKKNVLASIDLSESAKQNIFAAVFEDKNTKDKNSIDYAVKNGVSAESYIKASAAMGSLEKKGEKTKWIKSNSKNSKEIVGLYERFIEGDKKDYRDTISYAVSQNIDPKTYLQREIEITELSDDKTPYTDEDVIYESNNLVEYTETKEKSKNTKIKHAETLLTGGYTEEEIAFFWQKEYPDDNSFSYVASIGLQPSAYVDFKAQTFKADVDEDGKVISGTKKAKIASYINKMNISESQKLILKMSVTDYKYSTNEYQRVIDYVNARSIPAKDKLDILSDLGLKVVGNMVYPQKS